MALKPAGLGLEPFTANGLAELSPKFGHFEASPTCRMAGGRCRVSVNRSGSGHQATRGHQCKGDNFEQYLDSVIHYIINWYFIN